MTDAPVSRGWLRRAATLLYDFAHLWGGGDHNRISVRDWAARFGHDRNHDALRRDWERTKSALLAIGAPVRFERDGKEVHMVLLPGAREFAERTLDDLLKRKDTPEEDDVIEGSRFMLLDLDQITPPPDWRPNAIDLKAMTESLRECPLGQVHPVVVVGERPPYQLGLGRVRWAACKALGVKVLARVVATWDEVLAVDENLVRRQHTPAELERLRQTRDRLIDEAKAEGKSNVQVAQALGISTSTAQRRSTCAGEQVEQPKLVTGQDGKRRPAHLPDEAALDDRRQRARELRNEGLSTRQIGKELGVSVGTVHADLQAVAAAEGQAEAADREGGGERPAEQAPAGWCTLDPTTAPLDACLSAIEEGFFGLTEQIEDDGARGVVQALERLCLTLARRLRERDFDLGPRAAHSGAA